MRGKAGQRLIIFRYLGITPAYAGKRHIDSCLKIAIGDHPRLCGEKPYFYDAVTQRVGSPPPMRGKAEHFPPEIMRHRITPAYAGKSIPSCIKYSIAEDHPRLCGEKIFFGNFSPQCQGSPPPMRGKGPAFLPKFLLQRITPAYAGKSFRIVTKKLHA